MIRLLFGLGIIVVTACSPSVETEEARTEFATDFVFLLDVPYEVSRHVTSGESCSLVLPDGTYLPATIGEPLATVDAVSQTQPVRFRLAKLADFLYLRKQTPKFRYDYRKRCY